MLIVISLSFNQNFLVLCTSNDFGLNFEHFEYYFVYILGPSMLKYLEECICFVVVFSLQAQLRLDYKFCLAFCGCWFQAQFSFQCLCYAALDHVPVLFRG